MHIGPRGPPQPDPIHPDLPTETFLPESLLDEITGLFRDEDGWLQGSPNGCPVDLEFTRILSNAHDHLSRHCRNEDGKKHYKILYGMGLSLRL